MRYSSRIVVPVGCTHHASPIRSKPRRPSEFPALKALIHKSVAKQKGKVQYVLVAEDTASESMALFLQKNRHVMPDGRLFHDTQGQIRDLIRPGLPGGELKLPSTLLVDEKGVIRQAFVGPLVVFEYGTQALIGATQSKTLGRCARCFGCETGWQRVGFAHRKWRGVKPWNRWAGGGPTRCFCDPV